jgi:micrococcal nuclease
LIKFAVKTLSTLAVIALFAYFAWVYIIPRLSEHEQKQSNGKETRLVQRVVDGDTFVLENSERVRMLGIDTPEKYESSKLDRDAERSGSDKKTIKKLGELSSQYTKKLIEGKRVVLVAEPNYEDKDKYGRLLRYVYLEDGTFVNKKLIEDGYANAYRRFELSRKDEFVKAEKEARENRRGLWGETEGLQQLDEKHDVKNDNHRESKNKKK